MSNSRTLVQVGDKVVEIKFDKNGKVKAELVSDDVLAEVGLLGEGVQQAMNNEFNKLTQETVAEIRASFKQGLKNTTMHTLGFESTWGRGWQVDHCNGRMSNISTYLSEEARKLFASEMEPFLKKKAPKLVEEARSALIKEYREQFLRLVREGSRDAARQAAKTFLTDTLNKETQRLQKKATTTLQEAFLGKPLQLEDDTD